MTVTDDAAEKYVACTMRVMFRAGREMAPDQLDTAGWAVLHEGIRHYAELGHGPTVSL